MTWELVDSRGKHDVAEIFILRSRKRGPGYLVECVDALDPRYSRREKWCITISSQFGCPVRCLMCDAGADFLGNLTADEIIGQVDWIMRRHLEDGAWASPKIKLHFARMGEPSLNPSVLDALREMPRRYPTAALLPAVATVAPIAGSPWLEELASIKEECFPRGRFQLQFSVNSTSDIMRDQIMPVRKWHLADIARFGEKWWRPGDRRITLNFAMIDGVSLDAGSLASLFDPSRFLVKITPVNPTLAVMKRGLKSLLKPDGEARLSPALAKEKELLEKAGFEVILSIGSADEIALGSNCGQMIAARKAEAGAAV